MQADTLLQQHMQERVPLLIVGPVTGVRHVLKSFFFFSHLALARQCLGEYGHLSGHLNMDSYQNLTISSYALVELKKPHDGFLMALSSADESVKQREEKNFCRDACCCFLLVCLFLFSFVFSGRASCVSVVSLFIYFFLSLGRPLYLRTVKLH